MSIGEIMGIGALAMNAMGRRTRGNKQLDQQEELTKIQEAAGLGTENIPKRYIQ